MKCQNEPTSKSTTTLVMETDKFLALARVLLLNTPAPKEARKTKDNNIGNDAEMTTAEPELKSRGKGVRTGGEKEDPSIGDLPGVTISEANGMMLQ
jgi:hypothetical protein